jgi:hypothetical protein
MSNYVDLGDQLKYIGIKRAHSRQQITACHIVMHVPTSVKPSRAPEHGKFLGEHSSSCL